MSRQASIQSYWTQSLYAYEIPLTATEMLNYINSFVDALAGSAKKPVEKIRHKNTSGCKVSGLNALDQGS